MAQLFTIGYAELTPESLIAALREAGVETLVDVRANASSRKPGFSKGKLAAALTAAGTEYRHEPSLGIPSADRKRAGGAGGWAALIGGYRASLDDPNGRLMPADELAELAKARPTAIMCLETDLDHCHRKPLSEWIAARHGLEVTHL
jgi:uncharacterized protein (DUF488 family)